MKLKLCNSNLMNEIGVSFDSALSTTSFYDIFDVANAFSLGQYYRY